LLDSVIVTRASKRGRHAESVSERTEIILRGGVRVEAADARSGS
jgi:hypothetical protein